MLIRGAMRMLMSDACAQVLNTQAAAHEAGILLDQNEGEAR